jgi:hypothetical protein
MHRKIAERSHATAQKRQNQPRTWPLQITPIRCRPETVHTTRRTHR